MLDGQGAVRYCPDCRKNVYDFAKLRRRDINRLVAGGSVCGIVEREPDGAMRTADGPAWPRLVRRQVLRWIAGFASLRFAFGQTPVLKEGTGGLRGVVLEASGRPIAGARIWIGEERMFRLGRWAVLSSRMCVQAAICFQSTPAATCLSGSSWRRSRAESSRFLRPICF